MDSKGEIRSPLFYFFQEVLRTLSDQLLGQLRSLSPAKFLTTLLGMSLKHQFPVGDRPRRALLVSTCLLLLVLCPKSLSRSGSITRTMARGP